MILKYFYISTYILKKHLDVTTTYSFICKPNQPSEFLDILKARVQNSFYRSGTTVGLKDLIGRFKCYMGLLGCLHSQTHVVCL